jgi:hypothetical protein
VGGSHDVNHVTPKPLPFRDSLEAPGSELLFPDIPATEAIRCADENKPRMDATPQETAGRPDELVHALFTDHSTSHEYIDRSSRFLGRTEFVCIDANARDHFSFLKWHGTALSEQSAIIEVFENRDLSGQLQGHPDEPLNDAAPDPGNWGSPAEGGP